MSPTKRKASEPLANSSEKKSRTDERTNGSHERSPLPESDLWVDRYRPTSTKNVIGQQGEKSCVNKLLKWLSNWHKNLDKKPAFSRFGSDDGTGFRAALLSGQPGVGKTTSAHLVCKELGLDFIELNASDARSKRTLDEVVKELIQNTSITSFFSSKSAQKEVSSKHVIIMDEVDGMAGNEDRGGVAELIQLIKTTKVPIICICNDRSHPKMRSLVNYCFDLRFFKPRVEQIKGPMMSIAYKEGIQIAPQILHDLIVSSNQDIRQVLHNLSLLSAGHKKIVNLISDHQIKDVKLGPFEAVRKVFTAGPEYSGMSFLDKSDLFFTDYSLMPLMNFENYILVNPNGAKSEAQKLKQAMKSIDAMCFGDIIEKQIRSSNNWSLLPLEAAFASVMPGAYMSGHLGGQINFPAFMGKLSTTNKQNRLLQDLKMHMNWTISGSKAALNLDYLEPLRDSIIEPLVREGVKGVPNSIEKMKHYSFRREDIDTMNELTLWKNQKDPMSRIDSKVKAALTRAYNKDTFCLPYSLESTAKGKKAKATAEIDDLETELNGEGETAVETQESDEDIESDAMIKKKVVKKGAQKGDKQSDKVKKSEENKKGYANKSKAKTNKKEQKEDHVEDLVKGTKKKSKDEKMTPIKDRKPSKEDKTPIEGKTPTKQKNKPQKESKAEDVKDEKKKTKRRIIIESGSESDEEVTTVVPKKEVTNNRMKDSNDKREINGKKEKELDVKTVRRSPRKAAKEEFNQTKNEKTPKDKSKSKAKSEAVIEIDSVDELKSNAKSRTPKTKKEEGKPSKAQSRTGKSPQASILSWLKKSA